MTNDCQEACHPKVMECGLFDFMANTIGIKVLHPGGYQATDTLCAMSNIKSHTRVLDLACGTGTTAFHLHRKFGCDVTGIDISNELIGIANNRLANTKLQDKIRFEVGDALSMPFPDASFDFVIAQAFFVLIDDKDKAMDEIYRVLKPGGCFSSLELSWWKAPTQEAFDELVDKACGTLIPRMMLFEEWEDFFTSKQFTHQETQKYHMPAGVGKLLKTEGLSNFLKIMYKMMSNKKIRARMMAVQRTFGKYNDYMGYGLYRFSKEIA